MSKALVTRDSLQALLSRDDPAFVATVVGRALVALMQRQTESERTCNTTNVDNGEGFTGADARSGCITAKTFLKTGTLLDWQIAKWTKPAKNVYARITKYHKQLNEVALAKQAQQ